MPITFHPVAEVFPLLPPKELAALADDILAHGQRVPILIDPGDRIVDGRNRYLAICELEKRGHTMTPRFEKWDGPDPVAFIAGLNLHRRHLTTSQRATIAARLKTILANENRINADRQTPTQNKDLQSKTRISPLSANLPVSGQSDPNKALKVSERQVRTAQRVLENAEPEVVEAVESGRMTVAAAARVMAAPPEVQREVAASPHPAKAAAQYTPERIGPERDEEGHELPEAISETFAEAGAVFDAARRACLALAADLQRVAESSAGVFVELKDCLQSVEHVKAHLKLTYPYSLCPTCGGDGCKLCRRCGWVPKEIWQRNSR